MINKFEVFNTRLEKISTFIGMMMKSSAIIIFRRLDYTRSSEHLKRIFYTQIPIV